MPAGKDEHRGTGFARGSEPTATAWRDIGVGRGEYDVRMSSGSWQENRTIVVSSGKPVELEFHRVWQGERQIIGRLMTDGKRFEPSPSLVARAWTPRDPYLPLNFEPEIQRDGTFKVAFDAESLSLFFSDHGKHRSGFAQVGPNESSLDVNMLPMAAYSGSRAR